jgi:signal transduction histidine kinase
VSPSRASDVRVFLAVYFVCLAAATIILPAGPLSPVDPTIWLRGLLTAACGLGLLWLGTHEPSPAWVAGHVVLVLPQVVFAVQLSTQGGLSAAAVLLVFSLGAALLPLLGAPSSRLNAAVAYPLGALSAAAILLQGVAIVAGSDRVDVFLDAAGVRSDIYGGAMALLGGSGVVLSIRGTPRSLFIGVQLANAALLLAALMMGAVAVAPIYWILSAPGYLRVLGLALSPWSRNLSIDWRSAETRATVGLSLAATIPIFVLATVLFYGPAWAAAMTGLERQLLFGLVVGLLFLGFAVSWTAAHGLTGSLQNLARTVKGSPDELLDGADHGVWISEVETLRTTIAELYERLSRQNVELERASAAKDEFLGLVSHELKTPITTILAAAELMVRTNDVDRLDLAGDVLAEADRLAVIVDNLLALARIEAGVSLATEPVVIRRIAEVETARFARRVPDRRFSVVGASSVVETAPEQVGMVLRNYLSNAVKYSPAGSPITVRIEADRGSAVLAVHDTGHSLAADEAHQVFQAFYRTPAAGRTAAGIGIGLAVCRRVAEALGGSTEVRVDADGTEFRLVIPGVVPDEVEFASELEPALAQL